MHDDGGDREGVTDIEAEDGNEAEEDEGVLQAEAFVAALEGEMCALRSPRGSIVVPAPSILTAASSGEVMGIELISPYLLERKVASKVSRLSAITTSVDERTMLGSPMVLDSPHPKTGAAAMKVGDSKHEELDEPKEKEKQEAKVGREETMSEVAEDTLGPADVSQKGLGAAWIMVPLQQSNGACVLISTEHGGFLQATDAPRLPLLRSEPAESLSEEETQALLVAAGMYREVGTICSSETDWSDRRS
jgi:hypothetical protein